MRHGVARQDYRHTKGVGAFRFVSPNAPRTARALTRRNYISHIVWRPSRPTLHADECCAFPAQPKTPSARTAADEEFHRRRCRRGGAFPAVTKYGVLSRVRFAQAGTCVGARARAWVNRSLSKDRDRTGSNARSRVQTLRTCSACEKPVKVTDYSPSRDKRNASGVIDA